MSQDDLLLSGLYDLHSIRSIRTRPGPTTWLVPHNHRVPSWISGCFSSVAVRVTDHPIAAGLRRAFGGPNVSTSATPQGRAPARSPLRARHDFAECLAHLVPGHTDGGPATTEHHRV